MKSRTKTRVAIGLKFGALALMISIVASWALLIGNEIWKGVGVIRLVLFPTICAALWGFLLSNWVLHPEKSRAVYAGILIPLLTHLSFVILLWLLVRFDRWIATGFWSFSGLIEHIIFYFGIGLLFVGWVTLPVSIVTSLYLRRRHFR